MPSWLMTGGRIVAGTHRIDPGLWHCPVQDPAAWLQHHSCAFLFPGNAPPSAAPVSSLPAWPPRFLSTRHLHACRMVKCSAMFSTFSQLADVCNNKVTQGMPYISEIRKCADAYHMQHALMLIMMMAANAPYKLLKDLPCCSAQILYNTQPSSYTAACQPVTNVQVGQSVIPPGTNIPTTAQPPPQVCNNAPQRLI